MTQIPHLKIAVHNHDEALIAAILKNQSAIEAWFREQWHNHPPLLTSSVDLRNSGYKLAPIDTNVFPAGYNNLNEDFIALAVQAMTSTLSQQFSTCKKILIIPESHTRNIYYFKSLLALGSIIRQAGYEVRYGTMRPISQAEDFEVEGETLTQWPLIRKDDRIVIDSYDPCIIILNNDLSDEMPTLLQSISQPIVPSPNLGWNQRSKVRHFEFYSQIATTFCKLINIDPWFITPLFTDCRQVDFLKSAEDSCLVLKSELLFKQIQEKYNEHNIRDKPFVVIKADAGTYGMAVMMIQDPSDIKKLNRKQRTKMSTRKGGLSVDRVILQEGIYSIETMEQSSFTAEPVVYMIGQHVIGGFYRFHEEKSTSENLNSPGMQFSPLAFETCCHTPDTRLSSHDSHNQFYAYSVIARLAQLATCLEGVSEHAS